MGSAPAPSRFQALALTVESRMLKHDATKARDDPLIGHLRQGSAGRGARGVQRSKAGPRGKLFLAVALISRTVYLHIVSGLLGTKNWAVLAVASRELVSSFTSGIVIIGAVQHGQSSMEPLDPPEIR